MEYERLKIVFPVVRKVMQEVIKQGINSPNVVIAWAMKLGEPEKVTLDEVQEVLDMPMREYITFHNEVPNGKEE